MKCSREYNYKEYRVQTGLENVTGELLVQYGTTYNRGHGI